MKVIESPNFDGVDDKDLYREFSIGKNPPPDGYFTTAQWAEKWGIKLTSAKKAIKDMVAAGVMKSGVFQKPNLLGRATPTNHYARVKPSKPR